MPYFQYKYIFIAENCIMFGRRTKKKDNFSVGKWGIEIDMSKFLRNFYLRRNLKFIPTSHNEFYYHSVVLKQYCYNLEHKKYLYLTVINLDIIPEKIHSLLLTIHNSRVLNVLIFGQFLFEVLTK